MPFDIISSQGLVSGDLYKKKIVVALIKNKNKITNSYNLILSIKQICLINKKMNNLIFKVLTFRNFQDKKKYFI